MFTQVVVLGGLGQVGTLLVHSLRSHGILVTTVDTRDPWPAAEGENHLTSDIGQFHARLEATVAAADCVCVCLPENVTLEAAPRLIQTMRDGSLWVDTLSVKGQITRKLAQLGDRVEMISLNPMFAPSLGWTSHAVAAVEIQPGPKSSFLKELLHAWGARVEKMSADEHDRLTAGIQVATHAAVLSFGGALLHSGFNLEQALRIATPPHRLLLTLLYRMTKQNPEVYWDIQACHPLAAGVRCNLIRELETIQLNITQSEVDNFVGMFTELREMLAPGAVSFEHWSKTLLALPNP